jgi:hypothetical protein
LFSLWSVEFCLGNDIVFNIEDIGRGAKLLENILLIKANEREIALKVNTFVAYLRDKYLKKFKYASFDQPDSRVLVKPSEAFYHGHLGGFVSLLNADVKFGSNITLSNKKRPDLIIMNERSYLAMVIEVKFNSSSKAAFELRRSIT